MSEAIEVVFENGMPVNWKDLQTHGAAHIAPLMSEDEFRKLCQSMTEYGFFSSHSIVLYEGKILDGRNRWEAAIQTDTEPTFIQYQGDDPYWFSWHANVEGRRMLTHAQRAIAAARMAEALQEDRKASALKAGYASPQAQFGAQHLRARHQPDGEQAPKAQKPSAKVASEKSGVSTASIERVLQVKREDPAVFADLESGKIPSVNAAMEAVKAKKTPIGMAKENGAKNASAIEDVKNGTLDDHVVRERWLNIKSQVTHLNKDLVSAVHNCKLSDDELDELVEFFKGVQLARQTKIIDVIANA